MAGSNKKYAEQYAEFAMEQMRRYGIPASVTLAQGILESANGQSQLARNENNHFGIKATKSWLDNGGKYGLYTDDKPNEKFCSYASVGDSYEHHSKFLKGNSRYAGCFKLQPDDYKGWANGLDRAGYATAGKYAPSLIRIIEQNGLDKYDQAVMQEMKAQGKAFGTESNGRKDGALAETPDGRYSFPLKRDEFLFVTSPFGMRKDPMEPTKQQMHKGIDIRADHEPLLATEDNGKVIAVDGKADSPGGKSVTVEYGRPDGTKIQVAYHHLESINVKTGDTVNAGTRIGISGNTGTRSTGPHLHLGVKQLNADGTKRDVDPAAYLAEIAQKGGIPLQLLHNGNDLLAKYKNGTAESAVNGSGLSPEDWMKKLLSSEDSGIRMDGSDPIMGMVMEMFTSLMALAVQIDGKDADEKMQTATESALSGSVDLTSLVPALKECSLSTGEGGKPVLSFHDGKNGYSHELTSSEMNRLSLALSDGKLTDEEKCQRVAAVVGNILAVEQASRNYERGQDRQYDRHENLQVR